MLLLQATEQLHHNAAQLDRRSLPDAAAALLDAQIAAAQSVSRARDVICTAAKQLASTIRGGNTLYYTAAGSSALMAAADAMELGGTFNIPEQQIRILMAGGLPGNATMSGDTEDDTSGLAQELHDITSADTMIAVSASGTTPYTVAAAAMAKQKGATVIGIANCQDSELLALADTAIFLNTPPEVLAGSTRMGAGTAQKITFNTLSTLMAIELGHVYNGLMVNLRADNKKLRARAENIVAQAAHVSSETAAAALKQTQGNVKLAVLVAIGANSTQSAEALLSSTNGQLRTAISRIDSHIASDY